MICVIGSKAITSSERFYGSRPPLASVLDCLMGTLSNLPSLKSDLKEKERLLDRLEKRRDRISESRYERLSDQYREEIDKLKTEVEQLTTEAESRLEELQDERFHQQERIEIAEEELDEIETLYQDGALSEEDYRKEKRRFERQKTSATDKQEEIDREIDEVKFYLTEIGDVNYQTEQIRGKIDSARGTFAAAWDEIRYQMEELNLRRGLGFLFRGALVVLVGWALITYQPWTLLPDAMSARAIPGTQLISEWVPWMSPEKSGHMFRGDTGRTGVYATRGIQKRPLEAWRHSTNKGIRTTPALSKGMVYFGTLGGTASALNTDTGQPKWTSELGGRLIASPAVSGKIACFGTSEGTLYALTAKEGRQKWSIETDGPIISSPVIANGTVYVGSQDDHLYAVGLSEGKREWSVSLDGEVSSSPAVVNQTVYVGTEGGSLYALGTENRQQKWQYEVQSGVAATPAVKGNTVYARTRSGTLHAVSRKEGSKRWEYPIGSEGISSPAVTADYVFVTGQDGTVHAVSKDGGFREWTYSLGTPIQVSSSIAGKTLYVGGGRHFVALNITTGSERWGITMDGSLSASPAATKEALYLSSRQGVVAYK